MKTKKARAYRSAPRKVIDPLKISSISLMENLSKIASEGLILEASVTGFLIEVKRENLVPRDLRQNLNLDVLNGLNVLIYLPQMNLEMSGKIARAKFVGKRGFELGVDYSADAPEYWRECLMDLLPRPGEMD